MRGDPQKRNMGEKKMCEEREEDRKEKQKKAEEEE